MKYIEDVLNKKGTEIWSIDTEESVYRAIELMAEKHVGALMVKDGSKLAGIISERDYARKVILKGRSSKATKVADIMTRDIIFARPEHDVDACMALMSEKGIRHLPIIKGDDLKGMVSLGDLVKTIIADQQTRIEQLENYIYVE
jgi:CBS domain-containing protein